MRILLIGLGRWGQNHLRTLSELGVDVVTCDTDCTKKADLTDYQDFINEVNAVDIVTPTDSHFDICMECIRREKDIFVEKPLALNSSQAEVITEMVNGDGLIIQVGHIYRFHPVTDKIKEIIESGKLGDIKYAFGHFTGFKRPRTDTGVTQTDAIHYYDLFNYLFDGLPDSVTGIVRNYLHCGFDDTSVSTLHYRSMVALVEAGYMFPEEKRDITIVGDKGSVFGDFRKSFTVLFDNHHEFINEKCVAVENGKQEMIVRKDQPLTLELKSFLSSVKTRSKPICDAQTGYQALRIVDACYESSKQGRKVEIEW